MADPGNSLFRRLIWRQASEELPSDSDGGFGASHSAVSKNETAFSEKAGWNKAMGSEEYMGDRNSLLSLQPWIFRKDFYQEEGERMVGSSHFSDNYRYSAVNSANILEPPSSPKNFSFTYNSHRNRRAIRISSRTRHVPRYSVKPLSSVENCLNPQLDGSDFETQEFVFGPAENTSLRSNRSFHITDGSRIISKSHNNFLDRQSASDLHIKGKSASPKRVVSLERCHPERRKSKRRSVSMKIGGVSAPKSGPCDNVLLFYAGIGVGVISTLMMNKKEVDQLSNLLKQSENLVQELQEELSMKDSLAVNELVNHEQDNNLDLQVQVHSHQIESPTLHSIKQDINMVRQSNSHSDREISESMSKIEAELEAELERLELNTSASSLEGKLSAYDEFYPGLLADIVHGELREDMLKGRSNGYDDSHGGSGETSTGNPPANYAVSPRELTLRLHELNQSILENHIKELEARLNHSEKQLQLMEAERTDSIKSSSDLASSSNLASPTMVEKGEDMTQPLQLHELNQSILENHIKELEARLNHSETEKQLQLMEAERTDFVKSSSDLASSSNLASPTMVEKGEDMTQPLQLHELNQSILENHIKELEARLNHSETEKQLQLMEAERTDSVKSSSDLASSSNLASPTMVEKGEDMIQPLQLHELNQSILENHIKELEARLNHNETEKQLQLMEAERTDSVKSSSDLASSSNLASPTMVEKGEDMTQPMCLNLCDDALDAYEEAYDEFLRMAGSEERTSLGTNATEQFHGDDMSFSNAGSVCGLKGEESYQEFTCCEKKSTWIDATQLGTDNEEVGKDEEDFNDVNDNDDDERLLIQQIVERMRRSSSVVLNAKKLLLSLD